MVVANTTDGATVYLGHEDIRSAGVGFPIVGGKELVQQHSSTVYVHNADETDDAVIGVMEEYTTELQ
jgi:hypothetical protein